MEYPITVQADTSIDPTQIVLSWSDVLPPATDRLYVLERKSQSDLWFRSLSLVDGYSYIDASAELNTYYQYRVRRLHVGESGGGSSAVIGVSTFQGFDPILGPPFPPVNYALTVHPINPSDPIQTQPRLTWTAPDVFITLTTTNVSPLFPGIFTVTLNNYSWPAYAGGTNYDQNARVTSGGVRYYSLANNNQGHTPASPSNYWAVDTTLFKLYSREFIITEAGKVSTITHDWTLVGDSTGSSSWPSGNPTAVVGWDYTTSSFTVTFFYALEGPPLNMSEYIYVTATFLDSTVVSPIVHFDAHFNGG